MRSAEWFEGRDELGPQNRAVLRTLGYSEEFFTGKPVIGIANSWSEFNHCNLGLRAAAQAVKRGVIAAGGVPLEFNTISLGEELMKPSAMLYRNLMAMEIEETLRSYPIDGVVLLGGCDKTVPAQLMAAASANLPAIQVCTGPRASGRFRGSKIGSGTDLWKYWDRYRTGELSDEEWRGLEDAFAPGEGTCNTMGTASTMAVVSEALGMMLPGTASVPAADSRRLVAAERSGHRAVELVHQGLRPSNIMTHESFENALRAFFAVGGSTNAVIHLLAIAGRLRVPLTIEDFDRFAADTPMLLDLAPSGRWLMEEFDAAGGVPALLRELRGLLHECCVNVTGRKLSEDLEEGPRSDPAVIRSRAEPLSEPPTLAVLRGNLAPRGALIRVTTASSHLLRHRGPALVFNDYADMLARVEDPDLPVTADSVLILRNAGAVGVPGAPEWGAIPVPKKLLSRGIKDVVRISDSRMSGTSTGTVVLHITPEAAVGGPLALVEDGDPIELDVSSRRLELSVPSEELARRGAAWSPPLPTHLRGYPKLYAEHVLQPDEGCDFDFLRPSSEAELGLVPPAVGRS